MSILSGLWLSESIKGMGMGGSNARFSIDPNLNPDGKELEEIEKEMGNKNFDISKYLEKEIS